jgi:hypothetical protein
VALKKGRERERAYDRIYYKARYAADPAFRKSKADQLRKWRKENPEKVRAQWLRHDANHREKRAAMAHARTLSRYGLTQEKYTAIFRKQGGCCAICNKPETRKFGTKVSRLSLDHDHATGAPRGLLCVRCNSGLGCFRDEPSVAAAALRYLNRWKRGGRP